MKGIRNHVVSLLQSSKAEELMQHGNVKRALCNDMYLFQGMQDAERSVMGSIPRYDSTKIHGIQVDACGSMWIHRGILHMD